MKGMPAALQTHYAQSPTTISTGWKIVLVKRQARVTDITKANPGVVTTRWNHGLQTGDIIMFVAIEGMTEVNGNFYQITVLGPDQFGLGVDTSAFSDYLKGSWYGVARRVLGFTNNVDDLTISNVLYKAKTGADATAISNKSDLSIGNVDIQALIDSADIKESDIEQGKFDNAEIEVFECNYESVADGVFGPLRRGNVGEITLKRNTFVAEQRGLFWKLHRQVGSLYSLTCRAQLGDKIKDTFHWAWGCQLRLNPPTWLPTQAYTARPPAEGALGSVVKASADNGRHFKCVVAGTSGATEPAWDTTIGNTTVDGTAEWETIDALTKEGFISVVTDRRTFLDAARGEVGAWFMFGLFTFLDGPNAGIASEMKSFGTNYPIVALDQAAKRFEIAGNQTAFFIAGEKITILGSSFIRLDKDSPAVTNDGTYTIDTVTFNAGSGRTELVVLEDIPHATADGDIVHSPKTIVLRDKALFDVAVGTKYEIEAGCDKRYRQTCIPKFDNGNNFRGEPDIPGVDRMLEYPDAKV